MISPTNDCSRWLKDVSPEYPLDYLHEPFYYALLPGQGMVLVTTRG
jgi:hypothetical protein